MITQLDLYEPGDPSRWLRHPGCHRYAWRIGRSRREREAVLIAPVAEAYPKTLAA